MSSLNQNAKYICVKPQGAARVYLPFIGLAGLLLGWHLLADSGKINPNFLAGPGATASALVGMFYDAPTQVPDPVTGELKPVTGAWEIFKNSSGTKGIINSVHRIGLAVFWACVFGLPIGILMGAFGLFEGLFMFIIPPMRNAPITAFLPLFLLIYGIDDSMKVSFLAFGTIVYIIPAAFDAIRNVRPEYIEKAADMGFTRVRALWYFVLPASLPRLWDGIRICSGIACTYLVVAETQNITNGLGAVIAGAQRVQNTPKVYATIFVIIVLGVLLDAAFKTAPKFVAMLREEV